MLTSLKSCRLPCTWHCHHAADFTPPEMWPYNSPDLNPVDYNNWGIRLERVYRSQIYDVKKLKERLLREWRLLDHTIIVAVITQWRRGVVVWMQVFSLIVDILNINFEPLTFCCVLFVSSILVALNVIDVNVCEVLILCEMCYFCVWDFHTVW